MREVFTGLAIVFGIGFIGQMAAGNVWPLSLLLAGLFSYLAFRPRKEKTQYNSKKNEKSTSKRSSESVGYPKPPDLSEDNKIKEKSNDELQITEDFHFYDTMFRDQVNAYKVEYGRKKYELIYSQVSKSNKITNALRYCKREGGTYIAPIDVAKLLSGSRYFTMAKPSTMKIAALIFVRRWHEEVNRKFYTFTAHQVSKYSHDVLEVVV